MSVPTPPAGRSVAVLGACATVLGLGLLAALVGLYALSPANGRPDLSPLFGAIAAGVPGLFGSALIYANSRRQHAETTGALNVVTAQTNGVLTERIGFGVASALAARDAAVASIPTQTAPPSPRVVLDRRAPVEPTPAAVPAPVAPAPVEPVPVELVPATP